MFAPDYRSSALDIFISARLADAGCPRKHDMPATYNLGVCSPTIPRVATGRFMLQQDPGKGKQSIKVFEIPVLHHGFGRYLEWRFDKAKVLTLCTRHVAMEFVLFVSN